jgi:folate/biopterin transporter
MSGRVRDADRSWRARAFDAVTTPIISMLDLVDFVSQLRALLGTRLFLSLSIAYFLVKGVVANTQDSVLFPLYKDSFHVVDSNEFQQLSSTVMLAWAMKPIIGILSDRVPLMGYRKRWYLAIAGAFAAACCLIVLVMPQDASWSKTALTAVLFGINLGLATTDLLCEGTYARLMVLRPRIGAGMVSWMWGLVNASGVVACLLVGPLADAGKSLLCVAMMIPCLLLPVPMFAANWLGEKCVTANIRRSALSDADGIVPGSELAITSPGADIQGTAAMVERPVSDIDRPDDLSPQQPTRRPRDAYPAVAAAAASGTTVLEDGVTKYSYMMGVVAPLNALCNMSTQGLYFSLSHFTFVRRGTAHWQDLTADGALAAAMVPLVLVTTLTSAGILTAASWRWLPRVIARANAFMFLKEALYISCMGPLNYFFVADDACVPGGPHFSYTFYNTTTQVVSSISGAVGAFFFFYLFSRRRFSDVFVITTILKTIASVFDLIIVQRWNVTLGISDEHAYMFGDAIVYPLCVRLDFMAAVALLSRLCPKGFESSVYAALAGFMNFGMSAAGSIGAELARALGVRTAPMAVMPGAALTHTASTCDFSNLGLMIIIAHGAMPVLCLVLAYRLLPNDVISPPVAEGPPVTHHPEERASFSSSHTV